MFAGACGGLGKELLAKDGEVLQGLKMGHMHWYNIGSV